MRIQTDNFGSVERLKCGIAMNRYSFAPHLHQYSELTIVLDGEITVSLDGKTKTIGKGEAAFIPPFKTHSYNSVSDNKIWICVFTSSFIESLVSDGELLTGWEDFTFKISDELMSYFVKRLPDYKEQSVPSDKKTHRFFKALLAPLMEEFLACARPLEKRYRGNAISSILIYMNAHAKENISREDVGAALGYHPAYVSRCISSLYNMNFRQLLNSFRIDYAKSLLKKTRFNVIDIALECGFSGERSFHRAFLWQTGVTPGEFRRGDYI